MLNRRHFRVKVMQTIYAMHRHESDSLDKEERFLLQSIENSQDLYLVMLSIFNELQLKEKAYLELASKKHLATKEEQNPNFKFVNNSFFKILGNHTAFYDKLEERKIDNWKRNDDCIIFLLEAIKTSDIYKRYMAVETSEFKKDIFFIYDVFNEIIAPNEKLYDYLEDYKITWVDDIPVINTLLSKQIKSIKSFDDSLELPVVFKDLDDKEFVRNLFRKTVLNELEFAATFENKTPNWDKERIAELDTIILKMAICELLKFPSIPVKVTLNEYLEIAKEYSTPKSSIFINGILDNLVKEFQADDKIKKRVEDYYKLMIMKKIIRIFVLASLLITWSCKKEVITEDEISRRIQENANAPKTKVKFDKEVHDFGEIMQGEIVSTTFTIKNIGENDLYVVEAHGSCGCTVPEVTKEAIEPGESAPIQVKFDSNGKSGEVTKSVMITCNTAKIVETINIKASIKSK